MALEFAKNIIDLMVSRMSRVKGNSTNTIDRDNHMTLGKNGKFLDFNPRETSSDCIHAIQEAYWSIASALSEADGIDYADPDEDPPVLSDLQETTFVRLLELITGL